MLGELQALQPKEGMRHAEQSGDDLQGLAGILACPDGAVSGDPGRLGVIDLGEGGGSGLVGDRQQPTERAAAGTLRPANDVLELDSGLFLPLVEACVRQVDLEGGRIVIAAGFADPE